MASACDPSVADERLDMLRRVECVNVDVLKNCLADKAIGAETIR